MPTFTLSEQRKEARLISQLGIDILRKKYIYKKYSISYRKIHYLTREFRVKLHAKRDIGFQVQFNAEFTTQVMAFP